MRNLKKILALVLALVMSLSLVTIASGADFTDADDIELTEAVEVMSTIGVLEGHDTGAFSPKGTLTREQAAKIITYMLLGTNADKLSVGTSRYSDVAVTRWSAPAIEYCATLGIIDGNGDGTFNPAGTLTGYAFAKMLLTALGYKSSVEGFTGTSWTINVARYALEVGLDKGMGGIVWGNSITREQAAQMALNAIKAPLVAYDGSTTIVVNGAEVSFGTGDAYYVTTTLAKEQRISTQTLSNTGLYTVEFGERYFPGLRLVEDVDDFDRPSYTWTYNTEEIGSYVNYDLLVETYTTGITGQDLYNLLTGSIIKEYDVYYYVDGVSDDNIKSSNMIRTNTIVYDGTGNGVLTQVFVDHDAEEIIITSINTYLAKANADYNEKRGELSLTVYDKVDGSAKTVDVDDIANITGYEEGDFVLVNMAEMNEAGVLEVAKVFDPEVMSDVSLTKYSSESYLVTDGDQYDYAEKGTFYNADPLVNYTNDALKGYTYNIFIDQYGYVIGTEEATGEANYLFLTGYDRPQTHLGIKTAEAAAIFLDGTMSEIEVNVTKTDSKIGNTVGYNKLSDLNDDWMSRYNRWFTYTTDSDGVYTLTPVDNWLNVGYNNIPNAVINSASVRLTGTAGSNKLGVGETDNGRDRAYGNDYSVYVTVDLGRNDYNSSIIDDVNAVYTGVQNVDIKITKDGSANPIGESVFAVYDEDLYVIGAIVIGEDVNNNKNYAYGIDNQAMNEYITEADGSYYWDFDAIVDGEVVTLTVKSEYDEVINRIRNAVVVGEGAMLELTYDADGYVVEALVLTDGMNYDGAAEDFIYGNDEYTVRDINSGNFDDGIYLVDVNNITDLYTTGKTLYIHHDADDDDADFGLTIDAGAPVIIIQEVVDKDGEHVKVEVEEYADFNGALSALAYEEAFRGQIAAVLNNKGTAEYVVLNSDRPDGMVNDDDSTPGNAAIKSTNVALSGDKNSLWLNLLDKDGDKVTTGTVSYTIYWRTENQATFDVFETKKDVDCADIAADAIVNGLPKNSSWYVVIDGIDAPTNTVTKI